MEKTAWEIAQNVVQILDNKKGQNIEAIRVTDISTLCEYFVLCTGGSTTQVKALAEEVEFKMKQDFELPPSRTEGYQSGSWIVVDYGCVIVHVFSQEMREFYNLEHLWADGEKMDLSSIVKE
ncbi:MAG: ribosome silencing factor [Eubacteriales bacterium]|jgi:ribosome-associated protein